jgi:hypothetical protein
MRDVEHAWSPHVGWRAHGLAEPMMNVTRVDRHTDHAWGWAGRRSMCTVLDGRPQNQRHRGD